MSLSAVVLEGVKRAAAHAALLFNLTGPSGPAAEPPPARVEAAAPLVIDGSIAGTGLTLVAHHLDARVAGARASVQIALRLRNDTGAAIPVQYVLPHPARVVRGDALGRPEGGEPIPRDDAADLAHDAAERVETAPGQPLQRYDVIVVEPGEQIDVAVLHDVPLSVRGGVHRLQLPLPLDSAAPWTPRFTADVWVEADRPIRRLASPTHPALVDGVGEATALLSVMDGRVHRQSQLTVEFELDAVAPGAAALALDRAPADRNR
jgi:hypothetical protein